MDLIVSRALKPSDAYNAAKAHITALEAELISIALSYSLNCAEWLSQLKRSTLDTPRPSQAQIEGAKAKREANDVRANVESRKLWLVLMIVKC